MIVLLMGVSGSGKTTAGLGLASQLGWPFHDADEFHPLANIEKMRRGEPLNDDDRAPWLQAMGQAMTEFTAANRPAIFTCSALKRVYRQQLRAAAPPINMVSLEVGRATLEARLACRAGHFFNPALLDSQLRTLEPMTDADLRVDASQPVEQIVRQIIEALKLTSS
jgi:gluconokinase